MSALPDTVAGQTERLGRQARGDGEWDVLVNGERIGTVRREVGFRGTLQMPFRQVVWMHASAAPGAYVAADSVRVALELIALLEVLFQAGKASTDAASQPEVIALLARCTLRRLSVEDKR